MDAFAALADPTRREIVCLLEHGPMDATQIAERFDISQPAVSKHLKRLLEGALVTRTTRGQRRVYALDPAGLEEVEDWVASRRRAWERRLAALEKHVTENQRDKRREGG